MKTIILNLSCLLISLVLFSCRGEVISTISESEAAEVIQNVIITETEGLSSQVEDAAKLAEAYLDSCGVPYDSTMNKVDNQGIRTYEYTMDWKWQTNCNQFDNPETFSIGFSSDGTYETPRMSSKDSTDGNFVLSGLALSAAEFVYNGSVTRDGYQESQIGNQSSFTSQIQLATTNLTFHKLDKEISSGTVDVILSGDDSNNNSFSFTGEIVFYGGQTADLTINGNIYPIQW